MKSIKAKSSRNIGLSKFKSDNPENKFDVLNEKLEKLMNISEKYSWNLHEIMKEMKVKSKSKFKTTNPNLKAVSYFPQI